jgi:preprotein translocase subunit SecF
MGRMSQLGNALYEGDTSIDFVGRKWTWYAISLVVVVVALSGVFFRGLNFGIEFEGGVEYQVPVSASQAGQETADEVRDVVIDTGLEAAAQPTVNTAGSEGSASIRVLTAEMTNEEAAQVREAISEAVGISPDDISTNEVGASWGTQVAERALTGLVVFLVLVSLFIWAYCREWKFSVGAMVALAHDLLITIGIYAWSGFEVTPSTVTGVLTILGFSLYDTVVVFDKVKENTRGKRQDSRTYAQLANLAVNQTLVRSINTSIVALLPVGVILWVGITVLGSGSLVDLSLALFVGTAVGAYSSIFIATPLAVHLKQGEKEVVRGDDRARSRSRRESSADPYAEVPTFVEGMPVEDEPGYDDPAGRGGEVDDDRPRTAPPRRPEATGAGRTAPDPKAPMRDGGSAKRSQPRREPRSKRR